MKTEQETYRGYSIEYSAKWRGAPTGGCVLAVRVTPLRPGLELLGFHEEVPSLARDDKTALDLARARAISLVEDARNKPTKEGLRRYPSMGYCTSYGDIAHPCTCQVSCPDHCDGACGCNACQQSRADSLENEG